MLLDQLGIHNNVTEPTVTIVIKNKVGKATTYSSWARYKALCVNNHEMTSEFSLKLEFVLDLSEAKSPQRCIVFINLDSSLPVIERRSEEAERAEAIGFFLVLRTEWETVKISIDFVDYLIAKSFSGLVEEWFNTLEELTSGSVNSYLLSKFDLIRTVFGQLPRFGFSCYLAAYVWFAHWQPYLLGRTTLAVAIGLILWSAFVIVETIGSKRIFRRISANILPSVIILNDVDAKAYRRLQDARNSAVGTFGLAALTAIIGFSVNMATSFLYTYLTTP